MQIQVRGKPLDAAASYKLATSDFLAPGGDGVIGRLQLPEGRIRMTDTILREALADVLRGWNATPREAIDPARRYSATRLRLDYEGTRSPVVHSRARPTQATLARSQDHDDGIGVPLCSSVRSRRGGRS